MSGLWPVEPVGKHGRRAGTVSRTLLSFGCVVRKLRPSGAALGKLVWSAPIGHVLIVLSALLAARSWTKAEAGLGAIQVAVEVAK